MVKLAPGDPRMALRTPRDVLRATDLAVPSEREQTVVLRVNDGPTVVLLEVISALRAQHAPFHRMLQQPVERFGELGVVPVQQPPVRAIALAAKHLTVPID